MKLLAIRDLFRDYLKLEPQDSQQYLLIITSPTLLKLAFGIMVDAKVLRERKYYVMFFGTVQALSMVVVATCHERLTTMQTCAVLMANFFGQNFNDVVAESYLIQQARVDPQNGQLDLQSMRTMFTGVGIFVGSLSAAFATQYLTPYHIFSFTAVLALAITYSGFIANEELETNEFATMRDPLELELLDQSQDGEISFLQVMRLRWNRVLKNLEEPIVRRVFLYMLLVGFTPSFDSFQYFFVLDILQISKFLVAIAPIIAGAALIIAPPLFNRFLSANSYPSTFWMTQNISVISCIINMILAARLNAPLGEWSDLYFYFLGGSVADSI